MKRWIILKMLRWLVNQKMAYDLMTALRGPDSQNHLLKKATTAIIRFELGMQEFIGFGISGPDTRTKAEYRLGLDFETRHNEHHFLQHAKDAFEHLNLEWEDWN